MITAYFRDIEKVIITNLRKAKSSVKIAVAWITNPKILTVIENLHNEKVELQIVVSDDRINFTIAKDYFQSLLKSKIEVRITRFPKLMHHKFCIIDNRVLITGSYNWTKSAEINNYENIILTTEKLLIDEYGAAYQDLLSVSKRITSFEITDFNEYVSRVVEKMEFHLAQEKQNETKHEMTLIEDKTEAKLLETIRVLLDHADDLYYAGHHDKAIEVCNQILQDYPDIKHAYEIIANCKWRQRKYNEQIQNAQKAIELDNQFYSAYNILAIGYFHIGNAIKSIENYEICIKYEPDNYTYYRNRAMSYIDLQTDVKVPKNLRDQFTSKANNDLNKIIELTEKVEADGRTYDLYYSRGVAKFYLGKKQAAKEDLLNAKELYEASPKNHQDVHIYREIKGYLVDTKRSL